MGLRQHILSLGCCSSSICESKLSVLQERSEHEISMENDDCIVLDVGTRSNEDEETDIVVTNPKEENKELSSREVHVDCIILDVGTRSNEDGETDRIVTNPKEGNKEAVSSREVLTACVDREHLLPDLPVPPSISFVEWGTPHSKVSEGHNVHDASVLYLSRKPLTASYRRPTWQLINTLVACTYGFIFLRFVMRPSLRKCSAEIVSGICQGQLSLALILAVVVSRWRFPDRGVMLVGISLLLFGVLFAIAGFLKGVVCGEPLEAALRYGVVVPQALMGAYVFLVDQIKVLPTCLFVGLCHVIVGIVMYLGRDTFPGEYDHKAVLGVGLILTGYPIFGFSWRRFLLFRAVRALKPYKRLYDEIWDPIKEHQRAEVVKLASIAKKHKQDKHWQPDIEFSHLMLLASSLHPWFQSVVARWAEVLGVQHKSAVLKSRERVLEKVDRSYQGNVRRVLDLVRASIIVESVDEVRSTLEFVLEHSVVFFIKNRYDLDDTGVATNGYRDVNLQLSFQQLEPTPYAGFVFELQIVIAGFNKIKFEGQHRKYIMVRNLRGD